ncbi:proton-coupled amino acid transporter-like protein pathetic isoform X1 [Cotesia typhae]|uniref:proton-coupled amino acid transporter-like protein pathetic isoform X1 n=1 Tax=Cotesia typhae TaxID=2053667 RepID=UPI003D69430E
MESSRGKSLITRGKNESSGSKVAQDNDQLSDNEEYDPFAARILTQPSSDLVVFMHLLKASIGSGILFLPHAFSRAGYVTALVSSVLIGLISCYTAVLTVQCSHILCRRFKKPSMDLAEIVSSSFTIGPERFRKYAVHFNILTNVLVCFIQYETVVIYSIYVGTSTQQIIENLTDASINIRIYIIMFMPIYYILALMPNFKWLMPFSAAGASFLALGLTITLYYFFEDFQSPSRLQMYTGITAIPIFSSIFMFAVHNMTVIMPLENSMKNPRHMPRILTLSMMLNVLIYMIFGFLGYNKYIDACDTVIKNLPFGEIASKLVKIVVTLSVICTYGLHYYVPVSILWPMIIRKNVAMIGNCTKACEIIFRLAGVTISTMLAAAIPQMVPVLGLLTAFSMTTTMLLMPIAVEMAIKWYDKTPIIYVFCRWSKNIVIFFIWLLMFVFGAVENLRDIINAFKKETDKDSC